MLTTHAIVVAVTRWRRPYRDPRRIIAGLVALVGSGIAGLFAAGLVVGLWEHPRTDVPPAVLLIALFLARSASESYVPLSFWTTRYGSISSTAGAS
jgi:hypothetical protein